jgi:predicted phosphodiesterase
LIEITQSVEMQEPDFVVHLGDILDFHYFGFNQPPPDSLWTKNGYLFYREFTGELLGNTTHFSVIGNWDGENGDFAAEEIERSRSQRLLYLPGPDPDTYPQGGSEHQDYFAFTWGDALFIVLNVMSYTPKGHYLSGDIGLPDDWTLGETQLHWLEETLKNSESKWKVIFVHHTVGGNAGDEANSAYGRGGGRAALVGEQATVHALMRDYGVQVFFYGHDHVFFDMIVDGIHYTIPGSTGAPWKFTTLETGYPADAYWTDSGYARVDVTPSRIDVAFVNINDEDIYQYSIQ